jgi:AP-1 complex subunit gamma-1
LCAIRILRKCPDLIENFVPRIKALLTERNHGVLLGGVRLMVELCETDPANIEHFRKLAPTLVRILKNLVTSGYAPGLLCFLFLPYLLNII